MRLTRFAAALVVLLLAPLTAAIAQQVAPLGAGWPPRPTSPRSGYAPADTGKLAALGSDMAVIAGGRSGSVELSRPTTELGHDLDSAACGDLGVQVRCALGFGVIGALIGATVGYLTTRCDGCESSGMGALAGIPIGFVAGAVYGAFVCSPRSGGGSGP